MRGLRGFGLQELDRHAPLAARALDRGVLVADVADQRGKSPAQSRAMFLGHVGFAPGHAAAQRALALDDFGSELQIGLRADAFEIVEQHRLAVGRRLGDPHVARNDGVVDLVAHELAHVGDHLVGEIVARVVHGEHDAVDGQRGLSVVLTCSTVFRSCDNPSSAKNSHCSGTRIESAAVMALMVRRLSDGGQSTST